MSYYTMDQGMAGCGCGGAPKTWLTSSWLTSPFMQGLGHGPHGACCEACAKGLPCGTPVSGMGGDGRVYGVAGGLGGAALLVVGYFVGRALMRGR